MRQRGLNARAEMIADVCDPCKYGAVIHAKCLAQKTSCDGHGEALTLLRLTGTTAMNETAVDLSADAP